MNQEQLEAAFKLLKLMDAHAVAQADAKTSGNWYQHLSDHLLEALSSDYRAWSSDYILKTSKLLEAMDDLLRD